MPVGAEPDGTAVRLDVSVWPQASGKHPVVLLAHGFGGTKDSVTSQANDLHDRGYVVVAWSARGHGQSGGRIHLNDPAYEIADARALLDLAAKRPDVEPRRPRRPARGGHGRVVRWRARPHARRLRPPGRRRRLGHHVERPRRRLLPPGRGDEAGDHGRGPVPDRRRGTLQAGLGDELLPLGPARQPGRGRGRGCRHRPLRPLRPDDLPPLRPGLRDRDRLTALDDAAARAQPEADDERRHRTDLPRAGGRRLPLRPRPGRRQRVGARRLRHAVCRPVERRGPRRPEHARGGGGRGLLHVARPLRPRQGRERIGLADSGVHVRHSRRSGRPADDAPHPPGIPGSIGSGAPHPRACP